MPMTLTPHDIELIIAALHALQAHPDFRHGADRREALLQQFRQLVPDYYALSPQ